jgi:dTDP-4-dehydrorhamnose 3,5-epimerase-like enzyme/dTDP-4-dehydrorhamnose reductase
MNIYQDQRGSLHSIKDVQIPVSEVLLSQSHRGVLRGLHYSPYRKQVFVCSGKIYDFWFEPGTGKAMERVYSAGESFTCPANSMHGFFCLEDCSMVYLLEKMYDPVFDKSYFWKSPGIPLKLDFDHKNVIISEKDNSAPWFFRYDYLLLGSSGYLGSYTEKILLDQGKKVYACNERLENIGQISDIISRSGVKYVICAAGISGRPTVAWCEDHEKETYDVNFRLMLNLMDLCEKKQVHLTIFGTGLLYSPTEEKNRYDESDPPNLNRGVYVKYRKLLESILHLYPNVLCLRILYPITGDGSSSKCFLSKMALRISVHNVSVPITVVPSLFPRIPFLVENGTTGPLNFVNDGIISLPDLLEIFSAPIKEIVSVPDDSIILNTKRLAEAIGRPVTPVKDALKKIALFR